MLSTRARLARNVEGIPFPSRAREAGLRRVADIVSSAVHESGGRFGKLRIVHPGRISESERQALVDGHVASRQHVSGGLHRLVVVNEPGTLSLMVNEEDHLRIQCILPGFQPMTALHLAREFDTFLSGKIRYARADNYGYMTSSLGNVGTGLRLSVLMHLAGLGFVREATSILTAAAELKTSIRGLFGEGTDAVGYLYQVSNGTTIGFSEKEIASRVRAAADHLISRERGVRRDLARNSDLIYAVEAAREKLIQSRTLTGREAAIYLSILRLGSVLGIADDLTVRDFNELLVSMHLGTTATSGAKGCRDTGSINGDMKRAKLVRAKLSEKREATQLALPEEG